MQAQSSCASTLWDNNWDLPLRRILLSFVTEEQLWYRRVQCDLLFDTLSVSNCTTLPQALALTSDSPMLQSLPEDLKCRFLAAVAAAAQG
jgi:hypothetical protein